MDRGDRPWMRDARWRAWGHEAGIDVRDAVGEDEHALLVFDAPAHRYVQMHGRRGEGWYMEADSGEFGGEPLSSDQRADLLRLGFAPPETSDLRPGPANFWAEHDGDFDVYDLVVRIVGVLAEVFACEPDDVGVQWIGCQGCTQDAARAATSPDGDH